MTDMGIKKGNEEFYGISEDEVMRERAIARDKWLRDQATRWELAWEEGKRAGMEEAERIGKEEGEREGKEKVEKEAIHSMHTEGISVEVITRVMKMSEEKILSIINQIH